MLVYRVCSQQEVEMIFDKGIENVGSPNNGTDVNSHSYQYNVNYLHFFFIKVIFYILNQIKDLVFVLMIFQEKF